MKAPFETGVASTGHRVENGICIVDTAEQAAYMAGPPFNFVLLGEIVKETPSPPPEQETAGPVPPPRPSPDRDPGWVPGRRRR
jgi:hypothetical protein